MEATTGTNAPVATRPEILCSTTSAASNGFLSTVGRTEVPAASFTKHTPTSSNAGIQNSGFANQDRAAFSSSVLAEKYLYAPTPPTPSSGEMATPVISETVSQIFFICGFIPGVAAGATSAAE